LKLLRLALVAGFTAVAVAAQGCAGGGSNGTGSAGSGGGSSGAAGTAGTAGTTGAAGAGGTTGTGGSATGAGGSAAGTGGSATGTGGTAGSGGAGTGGSAGSGGVAGSAGRGGAGGSAGSGGSTGGGAGRGGSGGSGGGGGSSGSAGTGGATGTGGSGGAGAGHGSAARFVCPQGQTYGNPLPANPTINMISAPNPDYFAFIEGPVWIASLGTLFFSDNASSPTERIWKLVPPSTTPTIFVAMSGSNGLGVDNSDQIIATIQRAPYGIARFNPMTGAAGAKVSTTAKPNDVIVRSDDNVYFTDPDTGFYRISPAGTVGAAMKFTNSSRPNGIELSLDENTLYVGDVGNSTIVKYTLAADGTVSGTGTMFASAQSGHNTFDGMCVDCAGNVYVGTSGGIEVYSSAGTYIGTVATGESSNCTFAGADRKTMYVTSRSVLKYVTLNVPGLPD
jgi:gluconolactonase